MIEGLKPYAEYKESGSKWLGKAPAHWEAIPLGRLLVQRIEQNRPIKTKDILSLSLRQGVVPYSEKKSGGNKAKDDLSAYTLAYPGDIVLNSMNVVVGSVGLSKHFGAVSPVYYVLHTRSKSDSIHYFDALFQDKSFQQSLWGLGNGILFLQSKTTGKFNTIRMRIPMGALRRVVIPHPESDEQAAIVRFLDHANRKIDGFIRAKRKLIGLLNEQKQAIIHRAVTRGLDPNVPLKPSGIPWLGDIPKHWEVRRAKYLFHEFDERSRTGNEEQLSVSHITGVTPRSQKNVTMFKAESYVGHKVCRVGDLAVNTMWAWMAALGVSKYEGIISPAYAVYRQRKPEQLLGDYADMLLRIASYKANYLACSTGVRASRLRLYPEEFFKIPILCPPKDEQEKIINFVEGETTNLNTAIARIEREIALMQEYRTRLTADIVTGKLDVREVAANLPDKPANSAADTVAEASEEPGEDQEE